jgi:hypothetical protein
VIVVGPIALKKAPALGATHETIQRIATTTHCVAHPDLLRDGAIRLVGGWRRWRLRPLNRAPTVDAEFPQASEGKNRRTGRRFRIEISLLT